MQLKAENAGREYIVADPDGNIQVIYVEEGNALALPDEFTLISESVSEGKSQWQ